MNPLEELMRFVWRVGRMRNLQKAVRHPSEARKRDALRLMEDEVDRLVAHYLEAPVAAPESEPLVLPFNVPPVPPLEPPAVEQLDQLPELPPVPPLEPPAVEQLDQVPELPPVPPLEPPHMTHPGPTTMETVTQRGKRRRDRGGSPPEEQ